jgi:PAT family beta-lactamase induction signal transducer AmpG
MFQSIWRGASGAWLQLFVVSIGFALIVTAAWPLRRLKTRPGLYLAHALGGPLAEFFSRFGRTAGLILALICLYRVSDFVLNIMNPFYIDLGFTLTDIAEVRKIFGVVMIMLGVFAAGFAIARWGLMGPLIVGALAGPISNLVFAWLATQGADITALFIAIGVDNIASGYSGTCLIAYMSSLTSIGFTATQYALFSSLYGLPGRLIASLSGRIVEGAAQSAESGGLFAPLMALFKNLPSGALSKGAANVGVSPQALGAGYTVFFTYSFLIGLAAVVLVLVIAARQRQSSTSDG